MYWWNVAKLAEDLREGRVEEKERFKYFLATSILWALGPQPFLYYGQTFKVMDVISAVVLLAITVIGTILCYRANRSGDDTDFIGRMICLGWPVLIKVAVLGIVVVFFEALFVALALGSESGSSKVVDAVLEVLLVGLLGTYYYWLIYKYMALVAHPKAPAASRLTSPLESLEV